MANNYARAFSRKFPEKEGFRETRCTIGPNCQYIRRRMRLMTLDKEDQRKQAFELFVRALQAAPDSLIKSLTGKEYAAHIVDGAKVAFPHACSAA
jgi:ribosomal protein L36